MATCGSDFLVADDFDAIMAIIDADMLENNTEMLLEVILLSKTYHQQVTLDNITVIFTPIFAYQNQDCRDI